MQRPLFIERYIEIMLKDVPEDHPKGMLLSEKGDNFARVEEKMSNEMVFIHRKIYQI